MKILVPLDGSPHSERALETAICLAQKFNGTITLIHVASLKVPKYALPADATHTLTTAESHSKKLLGDAQRKMEAERLTAASLLKRGHVV